MLVRALARERDASSCGHCSEKGATVSKAAPPIIPSMPSFFMIGLPDDNPGLAKCSSRVNGTTITDTGERFNVPGLWGGEAVAGAAVDLQLERDLPDTQFLDHTVDRSEWIAFVLSAVQDQIHAFGVLRPSFLVVAERAVDRDICNEWGAGGPELNAHCA